MPPESKTFHALDMTDGGMARRSTLEDINDNRRETSSTEHRTPTRAKPVGSYVPGVRSGKLVFTSGQLPFRDGKLMATGKVPTDVPVPLAQQCRGRRH